MARYFVGITGASGHVYATELIRALVRNGQEVDLAATPAGLLVLRHELGVDGGPNGEQLGEVLDSWLGPEIARGVRTFPCDAVGARAASGTSLTDEGHAARSPAGGFFLLSGRDVLASGDNEKWDRVAGRWARQGHG